MLRGHDRHLVSLLCGCVIRLLISHLLKFVNAGSLSWCCTVKVWHFCFDFFIAVLRWHRDGRVLRLFCAVVVIIKVVVMIVWNIFMCWSYSGNIRSCEVLRRRLHSRLL